MALLAVLIAAGVEVRHARTVTSELAAQSHIRIIHAATDVLGVPRAKDALPGSLDLGLCGPQRTDLATHAAYCGMFRTPTLRNAAPRY